MTAPSRIYDNGSIVVTWRSELCTKCGKCEKGLPEVFQLLPEPWVDLNGAANEKTIKQVEKCPIGALTVSTSKPC